MESSADVAGPLGAFMASVTWTLGAAFYSKLSQRHSPFAVNWARTWAALPVWILFTWYFTRESFALIDTPHVTWFVVSMMSSYALADALFLRSVKSLGFPTAQAVASTYPLWAALTGYFVYDETLGPRKLAGLLLAVGGTLVVILGQRAHAKKHGGTDKELKIGVSLGVITSLLWALNSFAVSRGGRGLPVTTANMLRMGAGFIMCPIVGLVVGQGRHMFIGKRDFVRGLPVFWMEAVLGSACFVYGLTHSSLAVGATLSSLSPVISVPVATAFGWEPFSYVKTAGVLAVVGGVALLVS